jgi:hypothetical protein
MWNRWLQAEYGTWDKLKTDWAGEIKEGESWGDIATPENKASKGNPRLLAWQRFREHLADEWVRRQVEAIRQADDAPRDSRLYQGLPLVRGGNPGLYAAFNPAAIEWLRCASLLSHRPAPQSKAWDRNLAYLHRRLAYCHVRKPVVLEFGWYSGGAARTTC